MGGCLEQSSGLGGENETMQKEEADKNKDDPSGRLQTEAVDLSDIEAGNLSLSGNYRLDALDIELKAPSINFPCKNQIL